MSVRAFFSSTRSLRAIVPELSCWARRLGAAVVGVVVGVALLGPGAVHAQLPELLPTTTTTAPSAAPTTLLPPLESLTPPPSSAPPDAAPPPTLLPAPGASPAPALLPAPPRTPRTTTFTTSPPPPRTALRTTPTTRVPRAPAVAAAPAEAEESETGGEEGEFQAALPFAPGDDQLEAAGLQAELGGDGSEQEVTTMASVAAGLIAAVLLGVVVWIQGQVRRRANALG